MTEQLQTSRHIGLIAAEIRTIKEQAKRMILDSAIEIGRRLVEAKEQVPHGEWGDWLRDEAEYSQSTANNLMRLYKEYGDAQGNLFGATAKSQALGILDYSKAVAMFAVPKDERESFIQENNVADMSTRELDKVLRERNEALAARDEAERAKAEAERVKAEAEKIAAARGKDIQEAEQRAADADAAYNRLQEQKEELEAQLAELQHAVPEPTTEPDQQALDAARKEAAAEAKREAEDKLKKKIAQAGEDKARAEAARETAERELEQLRQEREREQSEASGKIERLEKLLAASSSETITVFKTHLESAQEVLDKMVDCIRKLGKDNEDRAKLTRALSAMCDLYGKALESVGMSSSEC